MCMCGSMGLCMCLITENCAINMIALTHFGTHTQISMYTNVPHQLEAQKQLTRAYNGIHLSIFVSGDLGHKQCWCGSQSLVGLGDNQPVTGFPKPPPTLPLTQPSAASSAPVSNKKCNTLNE